jgi:hypothetical protein
LREERRLRVFENMVLRTEFGPKRDKLIGGWIRLHNEKLHALYSSPKIIRIIKSRRINWAGGRRGAYKGNLRERNHLENLGIYKRRILKLIFKKLDRETWNGLVWLGIGTGGSACELGKNPSRCMKCGKFFN